ncbi:hypothetical protein QR685DRAFT_358441 [Neurospora intermedia]|uniref:Uncharacterized protein n=1 Tax=Neurospora intermedia TaxID=5142 RepID=A0ABR3D3X8_NEUIN
MELNMVCYTIAIAVACFLTSKPLLLASDLCQRLFLDLTLPWVDNVYLPPAESTYSPLLSQL